MQLVVSFKANKKHRNEKSNLIFFLAGRLKVLVLVAAETRKGTLQDRRLTEWRGSLLKIHIAIKKREETDWSSRQEITLTHVGGIPASGQSSRNIPSRWTPCPWRRWQSSWGRKDGVFPWLKSRSGSAATRRLPAEETSAWRGKDTRTFQYWILGYYTPVHFTVKDIKMWRFC